MLIMIKTKIIMTTIVITKLDREKQRDVFETPALLHGRQPFAHLQEPYSGIQGR